MFGSLGLSESDSGHVGPFFGAILGYVSKALRFYRLWADPGGHEVASFPTSGICPKSPFGTPWGTLKIRKESALHHRTTDWCRCAASTAKCVKIKSKLREMMMEIVEFLKSLVLSLRTSDFRFENRNHCFTTSRILQYQFYQNLSSLEKLHFLTENRIIFWWHFWHRIWRSTKSAVVRKWFWACGPILWINSRISFKGLEILSSVSWPRRSRSC